jgi:hypothetical protein
MGSIRIHEVINGNGDWTVSFWVRGSQSVAVRFYVDICDSTPVAVYTTPDNSWKRIEITATVNNYTANLYHFVDFSKIDCAYFYIKDIKIEKGNRATDWSPAPEDVESKIDDTANDIHRVITEQHSELVTTCESIVASARETLTSSSDFDTFKKTVEGELELLTNQLSVKFTEAVEQTNNVNSNLQEQLNEITQYFTFDINGFTIGRVDNPNHVIIDHETVTIMSNGNVVQQFDVEGNAIIGKLYVSDSANLLGLTSEKDSQGNLNFEYSGG